MKLLKNIFSVALTNVVNFGTSFLINFILPLILTVADYGNYKQYILYMSFTYLFNLGFNDGIFIKYGGKEDDELNKNEVREEHTFIFIFQIIIFVLMIAYSIWQQSITFGFFSLATFFNAMATYHQNLLQAIGKFKLYSATSILKSTFNIVVLIMAIFLAQSSHYVTYIVIHAFSIGFVVLLYEIYFIKKYGFSLSFNPSGKFEIFRIGFFILIANMSLTFVGNVGSWIVNWNFPIEDFAQYSFQNSVLNVILLIVNAVGLVFYNVISKDNNQKILNAIKDTSIFLGIGSGILFFFFKVIIEVFLPNYTPAISMLSITFISIPYIMLARILIANLYKSTVSEKVYFRDSILFALFAFILVYIFHLIFGSMQAIAMGTTISYALWFLFASRVKFPYLKSSNKELILLVSHFIMFYISANYLNTLAGLTLYLIYFVVVIILSKNKFKEILILLRD